ncbi:MAG: hypothetical protein JRI95_04230 [Deltaproteobacteria bacterium]|nr:hypothetical protein [Deltaproteobacteria bacterium]
MSYGAPDRVPCFEEGIREGVLDTWRKQGLRADMSLSQLFHFDRREEIVVDLDPRPKLEKYPSSRSELDTFRQRLDPFDQGRIPKDWTERVHAWRNRDHVLMLRIHRGFFLTMGVQDWRRFREVIYLLSDDPVFIREAMTIQGEFAAKLTELLLKHVEIDAAVFGEPIGGNDRPLISPKMYEEFVLTSYEPILSVLRQYKVETIILLTYANTRALIPSIMKYGFNCLWAGEVNQETMDYRNIRREFGRDLRLIGGIDLDVLRSDRESIRREIEKKVPSLIADGGYVPLADGRVRTDVPFQNYVYYRQLLEKAAQR